MSESPAFYTGAEDRWMVWVALIAAGLGIAGIISLAITPPSPHSYRLNDGSVVECKEIDAREATVNLYKCADGKAYYSQTNVVRLK